MIWYAFEILTVTMPTQKKLTLKELKSMISEAVSRQLSEQVDNTNLYHDVAHNGARAIDKMFQSSGIMMSHDFLDGLKDALVDYFRSEEAAGVIYGDQMRQESLDSEKLTEQTHSENAIDETSYKILSKEYQRIRSMSIKLDSYQKMIIKALEENDKVRYRSLLQSIERYFSEYANPKVVKVLGRLSK